MPFEPEPSEVHGTWLPLEVESAQPVPEDLYGYVAVSSQGGGSALEAEQLLDTEPYHAGERDRREATRAIESVGLRITAESRLGIAVAGPKGAFEELTGGEVVAREVLLHAEAGRQRYVTHLDIIGGDQPDTLGVGMAASAAAGIEGVLLERPRIPQAVFPSPIPPQVAKFHLRVPDDVSLLLGATIAHRQGHVGDGVVVAMVDSGQYAHPFFLAHDYDVRPAVSLVAGTDRARDPVGHGTGESANIFATAPGATLRPYRASNDQGSLVAAIAGFMRAKDDRPAVLTNSWGGDGPYPPGRPLDEWERAWALEIRDAVEQGIVVVFSGGNGSFTVEPQVPGVLAAGGAYVSPQLDLSASNYTSGYESPWFEGVTVPTVCGLVGLLPRAQYVLFPVPPGCEIDVEESQPARGDPPDSTARDDGWALFSGTSAAAPQLAGVAALLLGTDGDLGPDQVVEAMARTAIDVHSGRCHPRFDSLARPGHDLATGYGLVSARRALDLVLGH
jgi:subtilisin family serine protease